MLDYFLPIIVTYVFFCGVLSQVTSVVLFGQNVVQAICCLVKYIFFWALCGTLIAVDFFCFVSLLFRSAV